MCDQEQHANAESEVQMGASRADGGRRPDEVALEQYYDAAIITGWGPFNCG